MKNVKFIIASPYQIGGGPTALHTLCKYISDLGFSSKIFYFYSGKYKREDKFKFWVNTYKNHIKTLAKTYFIKFFGREKFIHDPRFIGFMHESIKGCKIKLLPFISKNTIVVYPEIVYGNFLNAKKVVRWLLYNFRYKIDDPNAYNKDDWFYAYRNAYNNVILNPENKILQVAYFDLNLYKKYNFGEREGCCYIIRKGANRDDLPLKFNGTIIDELYEPEKVKIFNKCKYCISFDTQTAYSLIAAMCGCVSIVVPEKGKSRYDYLSEDDIQYGVAYGFDKEEIDYAVKTSNLIRTAFLELNQQSKNNTKIFVEQCIKKFGEKNHD